MAAANLIACRYEVDGVQLTGWRIPVAHCDPTQIAAAGFCLGGIVALELARLSRICLKP
jgi:dienelactone hydrolase